MRRRIQFHLSWETGSRSVDGADQALDEGGVARQLRAGEAIAEAGADGEGGQREAVLGSGGAAAGPLAGEVGDRGEAAPDVDGDLGAAAVHVEAAALTGPALARA